MTDRAPGSLPSSPDNPSTPAPKKPRSPVERAIVWGLIAVLGGIMAFEARQKMSYGSTLSRIQVAFRDDSEKQHTLSEVRRMISGSPRELQTPHARKSLRRMELHWASLFKDYRMELVFENEGDTDPFVLGFSTPQGTDPESVVVADDASSTPTLVGASPPGMGSASSAMPRPGGTPGMGGGAGGQPRGRGMVALAQREDVVAELKLSEGQIAKLAELQASMRGAFMQLQGVPEDQRPDAMKKMREGTEQSVRESLDEAQFARLRQLLWRETGLAALERDDAATALGLINEQKEKLKPILSERQSALRELREAPADVVAQARQEWDERIRATLTEEQVKQWEELLGPPLAVAGKSEPAVGQ
jgi:hypothetical protein